MVLAKSFLASKEELIEIESVMEIVEGTKSIIDKVEKVSSIRKKSKSKAKR